MLVIYQVFCCTKFLGCCRSVVSWVILKTFSEATICFSPLNQIDDCIIVLLNNFGCHFTSYRVGPTCEITCQKCTGHSPHDYTPVIIYFQPTPCCSMWCMVSDDFCCMQCTGCANKKQSLRKNSSSQLL